MDQKNLDIYGHEPIPWSRALGELESTATEADGGDGKPRSWWLATVRPDGQPHVTGIGALWVDGVVYFTSGAGTRKSRNIEQNPRCSISVSLPDLDLVVEGTAVRVTDAATLTDLARRYAEGGWPATATDGAITAPYSAPSAGPAPWNLYVLRPTTVFAVATGEPYGAMRWRFDTRSD
jgi:pyridoxine/pyridoxamine 5'-phosphate oxidase